MKPTTMLQDDKSMDRDVKTYILPIFKCLFCYFCALYDYFGLVKMDSSISRINLLASLLGSTKLSERQPLILRHPIAWNMEPSTTTAANNCIKPVSVGTIKNPYEIDFQVPRKSYIVTRETLNLPPRPRRRRRHLCEWRDVYSRLAPILEEKSSDTLSTLHENIYKPSIHAQRHHHQLMKSISELPKPPPSTPSPNHTNCIRRLDKKPSVASKLGRKVKLSKFKRAMSTMFHKNKT